MTIRNKHEAVPQTGGFEVRFPNGAVANAEPVLLVRYAGLATHPLKTKQRPGRHVGLQPRRRCVMPPPRG